MQPFGVIGQNYVDPQTGSRIRKTRFGVIESMTRFISLEFPTITYALTRGPVSRQFRSL